MLIVLLYIRSSFHNSIRARREHDDDSPSRPSLGYQKRNFTKKNLKSSFRKTKDWIWKHAHDNLQQNDISHKAARMRMANETRKTKKLFSYFDVGFGRQGWENVRDDRMVAWHESRSVAWIENEEYWINTTFTMITNTVFFRRKALLMPSSLHARELVDKLTSSFLSSQT